MYENESGTFRSSMNIVSFDGTVSDSSVKQTLRSTCLKVAGLTIDVTQSESTRTLIFKVTRIFPVQRIHSRLIRSTGFYPYHNILGCSYNCVGAVLCCYRDINVCMSYVLTGYSEQYARLMAEA